jgi:RNA polymerase sigma factor (sigma-70 family)
VASTARAEAAPRERWDGADDWSHAREVCLREARRVLRAPDDAEEAAQEALLRAWRYRSGHRNSSSWGAWLARIARNEALRFAGRRGRMSEREIPSEQEPPRGDTDERLEGLLDRVALARILAMLGEEERRLVRLRYVDDLTQQQIAQRLAMPEGTVKVRLYRIRNRLNELATSWG